MNYIRTIISQNKSRFIDRKYNLDLSYITPRIIAMAYPGSGFQSIIRNNINDVSNFLNERHGTNYRVLNLSGQKYDNSKFNNQVSEYRLVDHHAPSLLILFKICKEMHDFLMSDVSNIIVVNCRAGKGRTGTVICCYLLYSGRFTNVEDAFYYYSKKRFIKGEGVTQPSQRRYVNYFYKILTDKKYFPYCRQISSITLFNFDKNDINGKFISPFCEFYDKNSDEVSFSTKESYFHQKAILVEKNMAKITDNDFLYDIAGDVTIKISLNEVFFSKKLGKISFNTAFLSPDQKEIVFKANEVDPDNLLKKKKVPKNYEILIKFRPPFNCGCNNIKSLCEKCKNFLEKRGGISEIKSMLEFASYYRPLNKNDPLQCKFVKKLLFGENEVDDIDYIMNKNVKIISGEGSGGMGIFYNEIKEDETEQKKNYNERDGYYNGNNDADNDVNDDDYESSSSNEEESSEDEDEQYLLDGVNNKKKNLEDSFEYECLIF